jgi:hypothetical protein
MLTSVLVMLGVLRKPLCSKHHIRHNTYIRSVRFIAGLVPAADMTFFSHRPAMVADNLWAAFTLHFNLLYFTAEPRNDDSQLVIMLHVVRISFLVHVEAAVWEHWKCHA